MTRARVAGSGCLFVILLTCLMPVLPLDIVLNLAFGWIAFLARVVPEVKVGWGGVATGVVCLTLLVAGSHRFLGWVYEQTRGEGEPTVKRWHWRWTGSLVAVIVLMFVAGLATVGVAHQVGWLVTSKEPLASFGSAMYRAQSVNNLKQIGLGIHNYHGVHRAYPPGGTFDGQGQPLHGWQTMTLPFQEAQADVYNAINFQIPWDDPRNAKPFQTVLNSLLNPGVRPTQEKDGAGYALSHYAGNARVLGARSLSEIKDGASNTIMTGEVPGGFKPWGYPANWRDPALGVNRSPEGFGGPYEGGANFLFADGSVKFLKEGIAPRVLKALSTPDGGEQFSPDEY